MHAASSGLPRSSTASDSRGIQLPLFPERLPFASGLPIGMARGDRKFAMSPATATRNRLAASASTFAAYQAYLGSARWAELRAQALDRDGHACRFCNRTDHLQVHHRRYPERWGDETVEDLTTICTACHIVFEWFRSIDGGHRTQRLRRR